MKKYLVKFGLIKIIAFLFVFVYLYKNCRKFHICILTAFVFVSVGFGPLSSEPASAGEADAFTPNQQHHNRSKKQGLFGLKSIDYHLGGRKTK